MKWGGKNCWNIIINFEAETIAGHMEVLFKYINNVKSVIQREYVKSKTKNKIALNTGK